MKTRKADAPGKTKAARPTSICINSRRASTHAAAARYGATRRKPCRARGHGMRLVYAEIAKALREAGELARDAAKQQR
jgi:hypothetical protein